MALVLKDDPGDPASNTYCDLPDATTYFTTRLHKAAWTSAGSSDKNAALVWATRLLDEQVNWFGWNSYDDQKLRWPRTGLTDPEGRDIDSDDIPSFLKEATAELAFFLLSEDRTLETNRDLIGLKKVVIDTLSITTDPSTTAIKPVIPMSVWSMIKFYGQPYGGVRRLGRC